MSKNLILCFLLAIITISCNVSSIEEFVVGENFIKDNTGATMIDTFKITTSTVMKDSLTSNGVGRILVGSNYTPYTGYLSSNAYFEMVFDDDIINTKKVVYDSLCMVLSYDTYFSGDTTVSQSFTVHRVLEEMQLDKKKGVLYTNSSFTYETTPFGSFTVTPRPKTNKNISFRLSDALGRKLTQMIIRESDTITNDEYFVKYFFNGVVIRSNSNVNGAAFGFRTTDKSTSGTTTGTVVEKNPKIKPEFRLYYHLNPNVEEKHGLYYKFSFQSDKIHFNQIVPNTTNSLLSGLTSAKDMDERSSTLTNNCIYAQSGIPYYMKLQIPYLQNVKLIDKYSALIGATLNLYPVKGTYKESTELPDTLYIYSAITKTNKITGQILASGSTSNYVFAAKTIANNLDKTVSYVVDISSFINSEMAESSKYNLSLMLGYGSSAGKALDHVILGGANSGKYSPKLNLYYYHN